LFVNQEPFTFLTPILAVLSFYEVGVLVFVNSFSTVEPRTSFGGLTINRLPPKSDAVGYHQFLTNRLRNINKSVLNLVLLWE
jgi:hypothetical protein